MKTLRNAWAVLMLTLSPAWADPQLFVDPPSLAVSIPQGGSVTNSLDVRTDGDWVSVVPTSSSPWMMANPQYVMAGSGPQGTGTVWVTFQAGQSAPGSYTGNIQLAATASNSPLSVPCVMTVTPLPRVLTVFPTNRSVVIVAGDTNPVSTAILVRNAGNGSMAFTIASDVGWIVLDTSSGISTGNLVQVGMSFTNQPYGTYTGRVTVSTTLSSVNAPWVVPVVARYRPPTPPMGVSTQQVSGSAMQGESETEATFEVLNGNPNFGSFDFTVTCNEPWLTASPTTGTCEDVSYINLSMDPSGLAPGVHRGSAIVEQGGTGTSLVVSVDFTVEPGPWLLACSGVWTASVPVGSVVTQYVRVWNAGTGILHYSFAQLPNWFSPQTDTGSVNPGQTNLHRFSWSGPSIAEGSHATNILLQSAGFTPAPNSPMSIPIQLDVVANLAVNADRFAMRLSSLGSLTSMPLRIWNGGSARPVNFTLTNYGSAFTLSTNRGTSAGGTNEILIRTDPSSLLEGVHRGWVDLYGDGGFESRIVVDVIVNPSNEVYEEGIVFSAFENGDWNIWSVRPDGGGARPIVVRTGDQTSPRISPDGNRLLYRENRPGIARRIVVRDLRTGQESFYGDLESPRWLADSRTIAGVADIGAGRARGGSVRSFSIAGDSVQTLMNSVVPFRLFGVDIQGRVTGVEQPGGNAPTRMVLYDPLLKKTRTLRSGAGLADRNGSLSFDGRTAIFEAAQPAPAKAILFGVDSRRSSQPVLNADASNQTWPALSPNGDRVAIVLRENDGFAMCVADANGANFARLRQTRAPSEMAELDWGFLAQSQNRMIVSNVALASQATAGSTNPVSISFTVRGTTNQTLNYGVTGGNETMWHNKPYGGTSTGQADVVTLTASPRSLTPGVYTGRFQVVATAANSPVDVNWVLTLGQRPSHLRPVPVRQASRLFQDTNVTSKVLTILSDGEGPAPFLFTCNQPWVLFSQTQGTVTGDEHNVQMSFISAGLAAGFHTAVVSFVSGSLTQEFMTVFEAYQEKLGPPVLSISTNVLSLTTSQYRNPTNVAFQVWNSGGTGVRDSDPLHYTIRVPSEFRSWLKVSPDQGIEPYFTGYGERDEFQVQCRLDTYSQQTVTGYIEIKKVGDTSPTRLWVTVVIGPPPRHSLNAPNTAFLTLHRDPPPGADGLYEYKTPVRIWTEPAIFGYTLGEWTGDATGTSTQIVVTVDADKSVFAYQRKQTLVRGFVTNQLTGAPVTGATVRVSGNGTTVSTTTFGGYLSPGGYAIEPPTPNILLSVEAPGYFSTNNLRPTLATNEWNEFNVALTPRIFSFTDFFHPNDREMIFRYTINGASNTTYRVDMEVSYNGSDWRAPDQYPNHVSGDIDKQVPVGLSGQRHFLWHVADNYPMFLMTNVRVRLKAGLQPYLPQQYITSQVFQINTRMAENPRILAYYDNNRNGQFDPGEHIHNARIFLRGRNAEHERGFTDLNGLYTWTNGTVYAGDTVFARVPFYELAAEKSAHGPVDDQMYKVWLDSDISGTLDDNDENQWDGTWTSFVLQNHHIASLNAGETLHLPLNHVLYEYNLTMDVPYHEPFVLGNLATAVEYASRFLYRITDGQMKLDKIYIRSQGSNLKYCDVRVRKATTRAKARVDGIYDSANDAYIHMDYNGLTNADWAVGYGKVLIHELGHYGFGLFDEYRSASSEDTFPIIKVLFPHLYPKNYGVMENQDKSYAYSSPNDYPSDSMMFLEAMDATSVLSPDSMIYWAFFKQTYWTEQLYRHKLSCWSRLKNRYAINNHFGRSTRLMAQRSGVFINGTSSVPDRISSDIIRPPYHICQIRFNDDPFVPYGRTVATRGSPPEAFSGAILLRVSEGGLPVADARVAMERPASIPLEPVGRTDADGQLHLTGLAEGDTIIVNHAGQRIRHSVQRAEIGGEVHIDWNTLFRRTARNSAPLTVLVTGAFDANGDYQFVLHPGMTLAAAPEVTAYANEETVHPIAMQSIGGTPARWQGTLPRMNGYTWTIDISALATNGSAFHSVDMAEVVAVNTNQYTGQSLINPSDELRERNTSGLAWRQMQGPLPGAPGVFISPAVQFALADRGEMSSNATTLLIMKYEPELLAGVDESTIALYRRDALTGTWVGEPHRLSIPARRVEAMLTNAGPYALFAQTTIDDTPPAAIADLFAEVDETHLARIVLTWTATGDDGHAGTAAAYELLQHPEPITEENVHAVRSAPIPLVPSASGTPERYSFDPPPEETGYFALRARDKAGNVSPLSNLASARPSRPIEEGKVFPAQYLATMALRGYPDLDPDGDDDGDGEPNWDEYLRRTDPLNRDTDGDGMPDGFEDEYGLDPLDATDADGDLDNDGLSNGEEEALSSDPTRSSTVEDGISDGWKHRFGLTLLSDLNLDSDDDNDTFSLGAEYVADTNPFDGDSFLQIQRMVPQPAGITLYLDASTQRLFSVESITNLLGPVVWRPVLLPNPGQGDSTELLLPSTNTLEMFRIQATVPDVGP